MQKELYQTLASCVKISPLTHQQHRFKSNFKHDRSLTEFRDLFKTLRHLMVSGGLYINKALLLNFNNTELL